MTVRKRLHALEQIVGLVRCPHCSGLLPGPGGADLSRLSDAELDRLIDEGLAQLPTDQLQRALRAREPQTEREAP